MRPRHRLVAIVWLTCLVTPLAAQEVTFTEGEAAGEIMADDTRHPYFSLLHRMALVEKTRGRITKLTLVEQREEARQVYRNGVRAFTEQEKAALRAAVMKADPVLRQHFPKLVSMPWKFIKVADHIESGLPHTRLDHIVMPQRMLAMFSAAPPPALEAASGASNLPLTILVHEMVHVLQRAEPELFADLYTDVMGFQRVKRIEGSDALDARSSVNPDAYETRWVLSLRERGEERWITPRLLLRPVDGVPKLLRDARMVGVELRKTDTGFRIVFDENGEPVHRPLQQIADFARRFPRVTSLYQPEEIAADLIDHIVVDLYLNEKLADDARKRLTTQYAPFHDWMKRRLGPPR